MKRGKEKGEGWGEREEKGGKEKGEKEERGRMEGAPKIGRASCRERL